MGITSHHVRGTRQATQRYVLARRWQRSPRDALDGNSGRTRRFTSREATWKIEPMCFSTVARVMVWLLRPVAICWRTARRGQSEQRRWFLVRLAGEQRFTWGPADPPEKLLEHPDHS